MLITMDSPPVCFMIPAASIQEGDKILTIWGWAIVDSIGETRDGNPLIFFTFVYRAGTGVLPYGPRVEIPTLF
jgi:hypothetical protein